MLRSIELLNFQVHKHLTINLIPGVNVIVGETNMGKSAILRALSWLIHARPLGAAKIWQTLGTKTPMSVSVTTDQGDVISRTPRTYTINDGDPLKAFGTEPPDEVKQLLPLQEINWAKQFSGPYIITSTGGQAAKLIGKASGSDDQEAIVAKIKDMLGQDRSEIKRQKANQSEAWVTVHQLKMVPLLKYRATKLKFRQDAFNKKLTHIDDLSTLLETLTGYNKILAEGDPAPHLQTLQGVEKLIQHKQQIETQQWALQGILNRLENLGEVDTTFIIETLSMVQEITNALGTIAEARSRTNSINQMIQRLNTLNSDMPKARTGLLQAQIDFDQALKEAGACPFCNQNTGGTHAC